MDKLKKQGSRIAELIEKGREQGYLTYADVNDHLPEDISDPDQVDEIIGMINDLGLQVHETAPDADTLMLSSESNDDQDEIALEQAAEALAALSAEALASYAACCWVYAASAEALSHCAEAAEAAAEALGGAAGAAEASSAAGASEAASSAARLA